MLEVSAGAIVYTTLNSKPYYLVICNHDGDWGFPKGHREENESIKETASREIQEETGIRVDLDDSFMRALEYVLPDGNDKIVYYFLASYKDQKPEKQEEEVKEIKLLPYEEALKILSYDDMKEIFKEAHKVISNE